MSACMHEDCPIFLSFCLGRATPTSWASNRNTLMNNVEGKTWEGPGTRTCCIHVYVHMRMLPITASPSCPFSEPSPCRRFGGFFTFACLEGVLGKMSVVSIQDVRSISVAATRPG